MAAGVMGAALLLAIARRDEMTPEVRFRDAIGQEA
jgi:hypothetical protein